MDTVITVLGEIDAADLGATMPHEHIFFDGTAERQALSLDYALMVDEVRHFKAAGGQTLVDVTPRDLRGCGVQDPAGAVRRAAGRNSRSLAASPAEALRDLSQDTGVTIIAGTGYYRDPYLDRDWFDRHSADEIAEILVRDITEGIDGTGVRAGIIGEIAAHKWYISAAEERSFRAAARAHKETGLTITTGATPWPVGLQQLDVLESEGVDPRRIVIGNCDKINLPEYHDEILRRGAWVQFDTIRGGKQAEIDARLSYITRLVDAGFLDRILLSQDIFKAEHLKSNGGTGFDYLLTDFGDLLRDRGLGKEELECLLVDNPRRMLTGS